MYRALVKAELLQYEGEILDAFSHGISTDSTIKQWDFWGAFLFCATVYTTIGTYCNYCRIARLSQGVDIRRVWGCSPPPDPQFWGPKFCHHHVYNGWCRKKKRYLHGYVLYQRQTNFYEQLLKHQNDLCMLFSNFLLSYRLFDLWPLTLLHMFGDISPRFQGHSVPTCLRRNAPTDLLTTSWLPIKTTHILLPTKVRVVKSWISSFFQQSGLPVLNVICHWKLVVQAALATFGKTPLWPCFLSDRPFG